MSKESKYSPYEGVPSPRGMVTVVLPHKALRNRRLERRVIEYQRDRIIFSVILFGAVLLLVGVMW